MLGKCLWKMWTGLVRDSPEDSANISFDDVLKSFSKAISKLPSRDSRKEPILEPHYKLVSVVHKLVIAEALEVCTQYRTKSIQELTSAAKDRERSSGDNLLCL
jgi:hypothetical protein